MAMRDYERLRKEAEKLSSEEQIQLAEFLLIHAREGIRRPDLGPYIGAIKLSVDPIEYQRSIRAEWP